MSDYFPFTIQIAKELSLNHQAVRNVLTLFSEGATIPFIARYRKEMTGSMDEEVILAIQKRAEQLLLLQKRKEAVIVSMRETEHLTAELEKAVMEAATIQEVEDIYLPYKPKRRTRATIAREKGLEPLADLLMQQRNIAPDQLASNYLNKEKSVETTEDALAGARDIIAERAAENIAGRNRLRRLFHQKSLINAVVQKGKEEEAKPYQQYFNWSEPLSKAPSHRILAMLRAENEGLLQVKIQISNQDALSGLKPLFLKSNNACANQVEMAVEDAWKRLLEPSIENEIRAFYKEKADEVAIKVFVENLRQLLLAAPLGAKRVLAIDPGFRTGCKVVVLDELGNLQHNDTIYPHPPQHEAKQAIQKIKNLVNAHKIEVIAIGNGTAGRETEDLIRSIRFDRDITAVMVNENGASVYSASKVARDEFPDYDITVRGAVSIGRRLMDPLAELVKIDPKSIGVGQYQHDVNQKALGESLTQTVESCVNGVGVELNSASEQLLSYVSGLGPQLASSIVGYRNQIGGFKSRSQLMKVPRLGPKAFEQSAGFLRIRGAANPLDASAVHPESYHIVEKIANRLKVPVEQLIGNKDVLQSIDIQQFTDEKAGKETIRDILAELEKPGRDPRKSFREFAFSKDIRTMNDLQVGMVLEGIVTNITAFGAFVDIGVHQDGLVHISQLANRFISDPAEIVHLNQVVKVKVTSVDTALKRIGLSMKDV